MTATAVPTLRQYLTGPLSLGAPDVVGSLSVFPLFGPPARLEYIAFAQGAGRGVAVHEREGRASINDLTVSNATGTAVLLYDGEEVLGAQQNRTFDVSVLVPAGAKLDVPVSCVEDGRWEDTRHGEAFAPAPQAAFPELRRAKSRAVREALAMGGEARAEQGEVWQRVADKQERMHSASHTGAMHDIYEHHRDRLDEMLGRVELRDGQIGAVVALGGRFAVVDHVSRPEVFAALHGPLVQGYALDALEVPDSPPPGPEAAEAFLAGVLAQRVSERDGIGLGREARFAGTEVAGASLIAGDELVQLTAFAEEPSGAGRIRRPSRRR